MMRRLLSVVPALLLVGCLSQSSIDGFELPSDQRSEGAVFFVKRHPEDKRGFDSLIADAMGRAGFQAVSQEPDHFDYLVTYVDRWQWDMRMYLIDLRVDVRDARTGVLLATGRSYQTSLAAMGKTHESIIGEVVQILAQGAPERKDPAPKRSAAGRRR